MLVRQRPLLYPLVHRYATRCEVRRWDPVQHAAPKRSPQRLYAAATQGANRGTAVATETRSRQHVDYTTLHASVGELQPWLPSRVEQVVQWHPQCVALRLKTSEGTTWLYLSWHPVAARFNCGDAPKRGAASEAYSFGEALQKLLRGRVLTSASLPVPFERVVQLTFALSLDEAVQQSLWCEVMGRHSNLVVTNTDGEIQLCAHQIGTKLSAVRQLQVGKDYQVPPSQSGISPESLSSCQEFRNSLTAAARDLTQRDGRSAEVVAVLVRCFQGMSPCLAQDLLKKADIPHHTPFSDITQDQLEELFQQWERWLQRLRGHDYEPTLSAETGRYSLMGLPGIWHKSVHSLLDAYYRPIESDTGTSQLSQSLRVTIKKTLTRLENKKKKLLASLKDAEKAEDVQKKGDLIIANLHKCVLSKDLNSVDAAIAVEDWETGDKIEIPLDPLKSAVDTAQSFFKRAKKLRRAKSSVEPLLKQLEQEIQYMREVEESLVELEASDDEEDNQALNEIQEELIQGGYMKPPSDHHLSTKASKAASKKRKQGSEGTDPDGLRLFSSPNGYRILIGRNNKQNDILSKTRGKVGDLWFHARGVPGAHVLLKLDGKSGTPEEVDIICAAQLAAYYSKAREGGKVSVSMTGAENVTKPRGAPPGLVQITKERSVQVRPSESLAYKQAKEMT